MNINLLRIKWGQFQMYIRTWDNDQKARRKDMPTLMNPIIIRNPLHFVYLECGNFIANEDETKTRKYEYTYDFLKYN